MRAAVVVLLSVMLIGCDPVPKQTVAERAAMEIETNEALTISHLRSMVSAQIQAKSLNIVDTDEDGRLYQRGAAAGTTGPARPAGRRGRGDQDN